MTKQDMELLKNCKNEQELLDTIKKNNLELSEEDLKNVAGGGFLDVLKKAGTFQPGPVLNKEDENK